MKSMFDYLKTELYLLSRRIQVYACGLRIYLILKRAQRAVRRAKRKNKPLSPDAEASLWSQANRTCAELFLALSLRLQGLWIKCGQYVASRSDVLPEEYEEVLSVLLDDVPPRSAAEVKGVIEKELGKTVEDVFSVFEDEPLASASIAQVHRAVVRASGQEVVVKVQHTGIERVIMQDLINLERIISLVAGREPNFDLRPVIQAWVDEVPHEMDFVHEMHSMNRVTECFNKAPPGLETKGTLPVPIKELTTKGVLVMTYVDGCKINDIETLNKFNVDRGAVVTEITKAYGLQMHLLGLVNGDPHSGNFLVNKLSDGGAPVLLDFGLSVELDERSRLGFARLVLAASDNDSYTLLQSFADMGIELSREDPEESLEMVHYLFRSTASRDENLQVSKKFAEHMDKQFEDKHGKHANRGSDNGKERRKSSRKVKKNPVDAFPGYLVFLFRSLSLLRGLCTYLKVRHSCLPVLREYARRALWLSCPQPERMRSIVLPPLEFEPPSSKLRKAVTRAFEELEKRNLFIGAQVAVYHNNKLVLDLAAGRMGKYNPRPVRNDVLFPCFSTTKGPLSIVAASVCDRRNTKYTDKVSQYWPAFARNGKEHTTVGHLLSHRAGLANAVPDGLTMAYLRDHWAEIIEYLEESAPAHEPGSKAEYHYLTFGWLVAEFIKKTGGRSFPEELGSLAKTLSIEGECFCGNLPVDLLKDVPESRVASLSNNIFASYETYAKSTAQSEAPDNSNGDPSLTSQEERNIENLYKPEAASPKNIIADISNTGGDGELDALTEAVKKLPSFLLEPTFMSHPVLREACIPAANGHFSARALARMYAMLANDGAIDGVRVLEPGRSKQMMQCLGSREEDKSSIESLHGVGWGAGLRLFDVDRGKAGIAKGAAAGHGGLGGSLAFCIPDDKFAMAVTVNNLEIINPVTVAAVLASSDALGVGTLAHFVDIKKQLKRHKSFDAQDFIQSYQAHIMTG